jgi:apolipoprotein N-acyltransferase
MGLFLTLTSAIFYYFSFPPHTQGYSAFISLTPFLYALSKTESFKKSALLGGFWGVVLSINLSIPLYHALVKEYNLSIFFSSLLIIVSVYIPYGIIYGIFGLSYRYFFTSSGRYVPVITASLWIIIDYLMTITPPFIPWNFAGYSQTFTPFIQIADITGIYGVTFLLISINSIFSSIFYYKKKNFKTNIFIIILITGSVFIYGNYRVAAISEIIKSSNNKTIKASVIQGNFNSNEKWNSKNTAAILNTYINMTRQVIEEADIIVWPETVLNSNDKDNLSVITGLSSFLKNDQLFITGATRSDSSNRIFNSILTADKKGLRYIYDKKILFPFTETSFAGLSSGNFMDSPAIFNPGLTRPVYKSGLTDIGYTICFESIYPDYVRKIKNSGALVLINTSNDSWFGNTYEPHMHLYSSIVRGIENRIYVIRSSNSGISAIISPDGDIIESIDLNNRDKIITSIKPVKIDSFYSKTGDWIVITAVALIMLFFIYNIKKTE